MPELEVEGGGKASLEDVEGRLEHVCDGGEVHWRWDHYYHYEILRLQFLPEISWVTPVVSLLVVVDSGVEGWPMASLHHLVAHLPALQTWEEGEAADQHQMYTDM